MPHFGEQVGGDWFVLSVTNPAFASWAASAGYRVGVVDTLRWMWDDETASVDGAEFYVTQRYWGRGGAEQRRGEVLAAPDVIGNRRARTRRSRRALVAFGGMGLPLDGTLPLEFAEWAITHVVPTLLDHPAIDGVDIVGGHHQLGEVCARATAHRARYVGMLPPREYLALLRSAPAVVATPGIATVHELQWARSRALLLPGNNVSQVLQLRDAIDGFGYRHVLEWPDADELTETIRDLPEVDGMQRVAAAARRAMATPGAGSALTTAVERLVTDDRRPSRLPDVNGSERLPRVSDVVTGLMGEQV
jgi:hypothetical protein